jgi:hypothetical protein
MEEVDFKIIKPRNRYSEYYKKKYYVVPCEIVELSDKRKHNGQFVTLKIIDPFNGELVLVQGLIYDKTIKLFEELGGFKLPLKTECCIYKDCNIFSNERFDFVIYGSFNVGVLENLFGINEIGFLSEQEKNTVFRNNYAEVVEWFKN